jgi:prolyl-tRNA synthetase
MRDDNTHPVDDYTTFKEIIESKGGFLESHWCGSAKCEETVKDETKATIRCIPFDKTEEEGKCIVCGKESRQRVVFARAY